MGSPSPGLSLVPEALAERCTRHAKVGCDSCHGLVHEEWSVLDAEGLQILNRARVRRTIAEGQAVFFQGDACSGLHCIDAGEVALRKTDPRGGDSIVRIAHAGQTLGHRAYFAGANYGATAVALTEVSSCFVPREIVQVLLSREPRLALRFLERLADELREAEEVRVGARVLSPRVRLARFLLDLRDRHGSVDDDGILTLSLPMSRQDIAAFLGVRRESVARAIKALESDDVAEFEGRVVRVADLDRLLDEVEGSGDEVRQA